MATDTQHTKEQVNDVLDVLEEFMEETLAVLDAGEELEVDLNYNDGVVVSEVAGDRDDIALIIGKRGQTLDAIQYLANAVVTSSCETPIQVRVDAQGYRDRRSEQLEKSTDRAVADVLRRGRKVELEAMTASERKVIHLYLQDHPDVTTSSTGKEPNRMVVILPRND